MIPRSFEIGPLTLHLYGLVIALSILAGWALAKNRAHLYKIPKSLFDEPMLLTPLILGLIGARLYHVLDLWSHYSQNPSEILKIANGGLGIWGGLFGILVGFVLIAKIKKVKILSLLDLIAPSLMLSQSIGRFGNFINQEAFGPPTTLPWGVYIEPANRPIQYMEFSRFHPTFFYEAALDLLFFFILLYLSKPSSSHSLPSSSRTRGSRFSIWSSISLRPFLTVSVVERSRMTIEKTLGLNLKVPGQTFALYLILYAIGRFTVEFVRIDTWTISQIKVAQILAAVTILIGIFTFFRRIRPLDSSA
ncbi:MAG: prolipoprotein diacylglyceryl transferase [Candidatus Curtissbacteria bacterium]|nr:prolipoprotein diacylglyceryl transferase [Candidatus Berkelbacteria bacterium]MCR4324808.1 prolipoprotein diacylglyceryl transferase [Candidatus Curtissbacteria bacterium]